ncbi:MAG: metallophosphoesterase [Desulfurococcales archaeon]|nr:metallophosphoesterase [Desulfurococcales archaeon]
MRGADALRAAIERVAGEPPVLGLSCDSIAILGDTHGYTMPMEWFLRRYLDTAGCLVVLGDVVDRGSRGVENLELIASTLAEQSHVYLLRGNHESLEMNKWYGFYEEALSKRGREYLELVRELYRNLPVAAVWREVFMVHGGIPCRACLNEPEPPVMIEEIAGRAASIKGKPEADLPSDEIVFQLLWNDPSLDIDWFSPSIRGSGAYYYGVKAWASFLEANGLGLIVRAHETVDGAIIYTRSGSMIRPLRHGKPLSIGGVRGSVITVFSSFYHGMRAASLYISDNTLVVEEIPRG